MRTIHTRKALGAAVALSLGTLLAGRGIRLHAAAVKIQRGFAVRLLRREE